MAQHLYALDLVWTGNTGDGTTGYRSYTRDVTAASPGKPDLLLSADKPFRGDPQRWNPEELLVAAVSECHMLSFLHVAVLHGVVVTGYRDAPVGTMEQVGIGGRFTEVLLRPEVTVDDPSVVEMLDQMHREAAEACFIAASVNFPVRHEPTAVLVPRSLR